jgi:N-acetylneuraminic acid mutarotase
MLTARAALAAVTGPDGRIYAIGGNNTTRGGLTTLEVYTPDGNIWVSAASMPVSLYGLAAALGADGRIYAIGGSNAAGHNVGTVEAYSPDTNRWALVASMPTGRGGLAAVAGPGGRIFAIGGFTGNGSAIAPLNTVEAYSPSTNSWATMASMPTGRGGVAAALGRDGRIYVMGGLSGSADNLSVLATTEVYTPATNTWAAVAPMPTARYALAAATGPDGRIYAIGGSGLSGPLSTVEVYTPSTNSWSTVASMSTARDALAATTGAKEQIYVIGGDSGSIGGLASVAVFETG